MTLTWTIALQLLATFIQTVIIQMPVIPHEWVPTLHAVVSYLQTAQGIIAHLHQPDGTAVAGYITLRTSPTAESPSATSATGAPTTPSSPQA